MFLWIPRNEISAYKVEIDGVDQTNSVLKGGFTGAIIGEESNFMVRLDNNNEQYTDLYSGGEVVDFYLDFSAGTTKILSFEIEELTKEFGEFGNVIVLKGTNRYHSELLDRTVTEDYDGTTTGDAILKAMLTKYLDGYGVTNVVATTVKPKVKWEEHPFYDAVIELCEICGFDAYVDPDKEFYFFERNSVSITTEAIVWNDNLINVEGLKNDLVVIRNAVKAVSEDDEGLPILYTSRDSASQAAYGKKEQVLKDTSLANISQAKELGDYNLTANPETRGSATSFFLPGLTPGGYMWIVNPSQKIHAQYRIVQFTHRIPDQITQSVISKKRDLPLFLKQRKQTEAGLEKLKNPNKMDYSFNLTFDDTGEIASKPANMAVSDGALILSTGTTGTMTSVTHDAPVKATSVHLKVVGEAITGTVFECSTVGGTSYTILTIDQLKTVTAGDKIKLKITFNSSSTVIKSVALLFKGD